MTAIDIQLLVLVAVSVIRSISFTQNCKYSWCSKAGYLCIVAGHLKILIPVSTALIIVADVKYAHVSMSIPTVYMQCGRTINLRNPITIMAKIVPRFLKASFFPLS